MRILEIITPSRLGGAERYVGWVAKEFVANGHEVRIGLRDCPQVEAFYRSLELDVHLLKISGKLNPFALGRVKACITEFQPDVVHTHLSTASKWGLAAARSLGVRGFGHVHSFNSLSPYRDAIKIIAVSQAVKDHIIENSIPEESVVVVHPASRIVVSQPTHDIPKFDGLTICCASRLREDKGVGVLLQAFEIVHAQMPNTRIIFCGDGPLLQELTEVARTKSLPAMFLGYRPDVTSIFQMSEVAVLPSIAPEGFGLSLLEAQAVGTPVVASDVGGVGEAMAPGHTGVLVPPGDPNALADALIEMLTDEWARKEMAKEAKSFALPRTIGKSATELLAVFDR